MAPIALDVEHPEEAVRDWLASETFGTLHPVEVRVRRDVDSQDCEAWYFDVVLPDPPDVPGTWPVQDTLLISRATGDKAMELGLPWPWYVFLQPVTDDEPHPDEPPD